MASSNSTLTSLATLESRSESPRYSSLSSMIIANLLSAVCLERWTDMVTMANALRNALLGKIWSWLSSPFAYWEWILRRREKAGPEQVIFSVDEDDGTIVETLQKGTINIQMLSVTPFSRRQRAVQFGKPNPIQYGQSFDCHDHGNSSTGALYDDILPAIETLANFPEKSDCKALPDGCYLQACSGTAGIYLCNKSLAKPVQIKCQYIERIAREVYTNYIGLHQDQNTVLDFCRRVVPITTMTGPKGREYTGNSFRKKEFATAVGDDMWSLQINRTGECYADQTQPRGIDDQLRLGG